MISKESEILESYRALLPDLERWASFVDTVLKDSVLNSFDDKSSIQMFPAYRIKDEKSFLCKALYRGKKYTNPLVDIEDKVGTRIVVLKSSDIVKVKDVICAAGFWKFKITKNIDQEIDNNPKEFDYQSLHIVVSPSEEDDRYDGAIKLSLTCEIQIRTLLQHAFAEISHDSAYKGPYKNDREIIRQLSKSMALMEATDDYFRNVFNLMLDDERYYRNYMNELKSLYASLNSKSNEQYVDYFVTDAIFKLLAIKDVDINDLSAYVSRESTFLTRTISRNQEALFSQPVFLLINYYFLNHRGFLQEHWPLSMDILRMVYRVNNTSFDNY